MKAKQNTYRKFKKHPVRKTVKLITALVALNAAGIILSEQIHENGYVGLMGDAAKTVLNSLKPTKAVKPTSHKNDELKTPGAIPPKPTLPTVLKTLAKQADILKKTTSETDKKQNLNESPRIPIAAIKQYYTSDGQKIDPVIQATVLEAAAKYGLCPFDLFAQIEQESAYNPEAVSSAGASGLMQFMPKTWEHYGRDGDVHDVFENIDAGARMMKDLLKKYKGDKELALAAYNAGSGNVDKWVKKNKDNWKSSAFKETADYIKKINQKSERIKNKSTQPFMLAKSLNFTEK